MNLYTYCVNNPIIYVDITGNGPVEVISNWGTSFGNGLNNINESYVVPYYDNDGTFGGALKSTGKAFVTGLAVKAAIIIPVPAPAEAEKVISSTTKGTEKITGNLSNVEARKWYLQQETKIPELINKNLSLQKQARQAFNYRNQFRTQAREMMANRELAAQLNKTDPNMNWSQIIKKYSDMGLQGDDLWNAIIKSSTNSRQSVNSSLGL